jgi:hypothetical protein
LLIDWLVNWLFCWMVSLLGWLTPQNIVVFYCETKQYFSLPVLCAFCIILGMILSQSVIILSSVTKYYMFLLINFLRLLPVPRLGTYGSSTCLYICRKPPTHLATLLFSVHTVGYTSHFLLCTYAKLHEERTFKFRIGSVMNICIRSWGIYFKFFMHTYSYFPYVQLAAFDDLFEATVVYMT